MRFYRSTGVHLPNRLVDYLLHRFARNPSRLAAPRKISVALKASFVIPAQPVAYPSGGSHKIGGGFAYARFAHIDHVRREHSCSRHGIFLLPACLLEFSRSASSMLCQRMKRSTKFSVWCIFLGTNFCVSLWGPARIMSLAVRVCSVLFDTNNFIVV